MLAARFHPKAIAIRTDAARTRTVALDRAHRTLSHATTFLAAGLCPTAPATIRGPMRARVIGNGLRELDRFLNVLVDAAAAMGAVEDDDRRRLARIRITADKLALLYALMACEAPCPARLIALGRMRACLFYRDGRIGPRPAAGRRGADWLAASGRTGTSARLEIGAAELGEICDYYDRLGHGIVAIVRPDTEPEHGAIAFSGHRAHMVAC